MRMSLAAAVAAFALLAGPVLAQQDNRAPAPADSNTGQLDNMTSGDQSPGQDLDGGKMPKYAFPDSTQIPQPIFSDSALTGDTTADNTPADDAPADDDNAPQ